MENTNSTVPANSYSQNFSWHSKTWKQYIDARIHKHLPHAILLSGEGGIGKLSLAHRIAKSLLCINAMSAADDACNQCQSCKTYESQANPDFTEIGLIDDKKQIGVNQIRSLSEFLNYSRSFNTYRVVIINPVEAMNINAANSLLKSLEEPTPNTAIILVTAKVSQLLATIKSRCQLFKVNTPSKDETISWLEASNRIVDGNTIDPNILYEMIGSKPLHASKIKQDDIDNKVDFFNDLNAVINQNKPVTDIAKKWEKHDIESLINWQLVHIQNTIKASYMNKSKPEDSYSSMNSSVQLLNNFSADKSWNLYQNLLKQKQYIHTSVNSQMFIENMIMLWI